MHKAVILTIYAASCSAATIHLANVEEKLRLLNPMFMMMEQLLNLQDENQCIEKMFCLLETEMAGDDNNPLKYYARFLTNVNEEVEPEIFDKVKSLVAKYQHISKLINAIKVGQNADQSEQCNKIYESCPNEHSQLVRFARMTGDDDVNSYMQHQPAKSKRDYCKDLDIGCSLLRGSCALCTVVTEGETCGQVCGSEVDAACDEAIPECISN